MVAWEAGQEGQTWPKRLDGSKTASPLPLLLQYPQEVRSLASVSYRLYYHIDACDTLPVHLCIHSLCMVFRYTLHR